MPLASATFRLAGDEEFELQIKPGTGTGFKGVQEVEPGLYQAKIRKKGAGTGFISLPSTKSVLLAAWWYAKACKAREEGTLGSPSFKTFYTKVRPGHNSPSFLSRMLTYCAYHNLVDRPRINTSRSWSRSRRGKSEDHELLSLAVGRAAMW